MSNIDSIFHIDFMSTRARERTSTFALHRGWKQSSVGKGGVRMGRELGGGCQDGAGSSRQYGELVLMLLFSTSVGLPVRYNIICSVIVSFFGALPRL